MGKAHPSSHARNYLPNTMFLSLVYPIASDYYQTRLQNPQPNPQKMSKEAQYMNTSFSFIEE